MIILKYMGIIIITNMLHWISVHVYMNLCAPMTWWGPLYSMVATSSPMCQAVNNIQLELSKTYKYLLINTCTFCLLNIKNYRNIL